MSKQTKEFKPNLWSFIRYAQRTIKDYHDLEYFLSYYMEDKVRAYLKLKNEDPTPEYDVLNFECTEDNVMIVTVDVYDLKEPLIFTIRNDEVTEEVFHSIQ